ncbi:MAG: hypothetical protein R3B70_07690 [Polyangiaceae bacterium]
MMPRPTLCATLSAISADTVPSPAFMSAAGAARPNPPTTGAEAIGAKMAPSGPVLATPHAMSVVAV